MKFMVIGKGARESAIIWKLRQDPKVSQIYAVPGNGGTSDMAENIALDESDHEGILNFARNQGIDMTIVGPEQPLVDGIVDKFRKANLKIIGPGQKEARLEGSKFYSKNFMDRYGIPTARYGNFTDASRAKEALKDYDYPVVIKADGLAAGKGVIIAQTAEEAEKSIDDMLINDKFGEAGKHILIEEFLEGTECSLICLVDGKTILPLESARDYKRALDGDLGLNTGGMGCFSPNPILKDENVQKEIEENILKPFQVGIDSERMDYRGILFIGLMFTKNGIKVLEFNVRFGDPETEVILPRLENSLADVFMSLHDRKLDELELKWKDDVSLCVVLASEGYPEAYEKGKNINISEIEDEYMVFHAGTRLVNGALETDGGRVIAFGCLASDFKQARAKIYSRIDRINFEGAQYRSDIGKSIEV
ncbi:MAG: phosphoribosylamine--glycine ligase [Tissierellales bacterium]|jgi:phosphoribosylamine--glycine ligase|nr:phosphoribosylamine--glycine ligase [Tissierellales bacterium]